jgi:hypothetical protein
MAADGVERGLTVELLAERGRSLLGRHGARAKERTLSPLSLSIQV